MELVGKKSRKSNGEEKMQQKNSLLKAKSSSLKLKVRKYISLNKRKTLKLRLSQHKLQPSKMGIGMMTSRLFKSKCLCMIDLLMLYLDSVIMMMITSKDSHIQILIKELGIKVKEEVAVAGNITDLLKSIIYNQHSSLL